MENIGGQFKRKRLKMTKKRLKMTEKRLKMTKNN